MDDSDNLKKILDAADDAFNKGDWDEATELYTEAYTMQPSFLINQGLAASLLNLKKADDAEAVILDYFNYYLSNADAAKLAADIVLENNDFLLANQIINYYNNNNFSTIDDSFILDFKRRVSLAEERHLRSFKPHMTSILTHLRSIVTKPMVSQIQLIRSMREFDKKDYIAGSKLLLGNPLLHPLLKSELAENLYKLGITEKIDISFYGEMKTFEPSKLKPIMSTDVYLKMCDELDKVLSGSKNETQLENLRGELSLYAAMVYPFGENIIKDPSLWTNLFLLRYGLIDESDVKDNSHFSEVKSWVDRFDSLINVFQQ
ncbi:tetratricopeptide repeat protein [Companilactobacillus baiquanensis]|uniref:Tetratricopeptide repeat protein n=1 Tax=Companilactobacillus baiquanensis TaxID=2486005 RepID=A0ABW1UWJ7_9LACO|nr:tetratricopeptide repeat protein [Companilactobacillus baiquanensis]